MPEVIPPAVTIRPASTSRARLGRQAGAIFASRSRGTIPGGAGTRQEMHNRRLHAFVRAQPEATILASVCTGSWIYARMGLLDGLAATSRKEPDRAEATPPGMVPTERLAKLAPAAKPSRARVVDAGRIVTAGGITSGMEMGFHLLRRAGYDERFVSEVARVMEYQRAYEAYRGDVAIERGDGHEAAQPGAEAGH